MQMSMFPIHQLFAAIMASPAHEDLTFKYVFPAEWFALLIPSWLPLQVAPFFDFKEVKISNWDHWVRMKPVKQFSFCYIQVIDFASKANMMSSAR